MSPEFESFLQDIITILVWAWAIGSILGLLIGIGLFWRKW